MAVAASPAAMLNKTVTSCSRFLTLRLKPSFVPSNCFASFSNGWYGKPERDEGFLTADDVISKWGWFNEVANLSPRG